MPLIPRIPFSRCARLAIGRVGHKITDGKFSTAPDSATRVYRYL
jgi:hypothetical protein